MSRLLLVTGILIAGHIVLLAGPIRARVTSAVGRWQFRAGYALMVLAGIAYIYRWLLRSPKSEYLWYPTPELYVLAKLLMPIGTALLLLAVIRRLPVFCGPAAGTASDSAWWRTYITNQPATWGCFVWAFAHLVTNGDLVSVVLFGTLSALSATAAALTAERSGPARNPKPIGWLALLLSTWLAHTLLTKLHHPLVGVLIV